MATFTLFLIVVMEEFIVLFDIIISLSIISFQI